MAEKGERKDKVEKEEAPKVSKFGKPKEFPKKISDFDPTIQEAPGA